MARKSSGLFVAILFLVGANETETTHLELPANVLREHPGKCFVLALCKVFNVEDTWELPGCGKGSCKMNRNRNGLVEMAQTCPEVFMEPECYLTPMDIKLAYPLCCPKKVCPGDREFRGFVCHQNGKATPRPNPNV